MPLITQEYLNHKHHRSLHTINMWRRYHHWRWWHCAEAVWIIWNELKIFMRKMYWQMQSSTMRNNVFWRCQKVSVSHNLPYMCSLVLRTMFLGILYILMNNNRTQQHLALVICMYFDIYIMIPVYIKTHLPLIILNVYIHEWICNNHCTFY